VIRRNTVVANVGIGGPPCTGGGIVLDGTPATLEVSGNLVAFNSGCGIACRDNVTTVLGTNLLWQNNPGNLGPQCPEGWLSQQIVADPLFCGETGDDYSVAEGSPALTGGETMGAFSQPGCGPVPVRPTTWGRLKSRYQ